jgi:hypothetical protein
MTRFLLLVCLAIAAASCSTMPSIEYSKRGATAAEKRKVWVDCKVKAGQAGYGPERCGVAVCRHADFMRECLEAEGWKVQSDSFSDDEAETGTAAAQVR